MKEVDGNDHQIDATIDEKMSIKLKVKPKVAGKPYSEMSGGSSAATGGEGKRVCPECKREFSSGKAFGGHMRVHLLKPKKTTTKAYHDERLKKEEQRKACVNNEGEPPTCCLCNKIFPSMKSLFGHMRCHPERQWRGILPPPNGNESNSSANCSSLSENDFNNDGDDDLNKILEGWKVTGRRGRMAVRAADDDDLLEAAEDLMTLAHSDPSMVESRVSQKQLQVEEFEVVNSNSLTNRAVTEEEFQVKPPDKMEFEDGGIKNISDNESDGRNTDEKMVIGFRNSTEISPNKMRKRKKMKLMMELEMTAAAAGLSPPPPPLPPRAPPPEQPSAGKYKCSICDKCYASHQALGGHMSSHKKSNMDHQENGLMNPSGEIVQKNGEFGSCDNAHECKICGKIYPSGQALGGHKRSHYTGPIEQEAPSSQVTSAGEAASHTAATGGGSRKVLYFDLNEIPPMTTEDEAGSGSGNGNACASSSFNSYMGVGV